MHVVERFTRQGDALLYDVTVEDPEVLVEPWVLPTRTVRRNPNPDAGLIRERGNCEVQEWVTPRPRFGTSSGNPRRSSAGRKLSRTVRHQVVSFSEFLPLNPMGRIQAWAAGLSRPQWVAPGAGRVIQISGGNAND